MPRLTPVHYRQLTRLFEKDGWQYSRTKGDHLVYVKRGNIRPLVIPMYGEVPVFVIKNLLRTAGMSRERYFELLHGRESREGPTSS
jgi:predicted RNA binding protein YcfA (HicA-like mRNA interferase family)